MTNASKNLRVALALTLLTLLICLPGCGDSDTGPVTIDFAKLSTAKPAALKSVSGLSAQEDFGMWSAEKMVSFEFTKPLPKKFTLALTGYALGPNTEKDLTVTVGRTSLPISFRGNSFPPPIERVVTVDNPDGASVLKVEIPQPISPKELGWNDDPRTLGLAFYSLTITPVK